MRHLKLSRRALLSASAGALLVGGPILLRAGPATATPAKSFDARNAMRFADMPDTAPLGLPKVRVVYASELWPEKASRAEPDVNHIRQRARKLRATAPDMVVIDIEHWHLSGLDAPAVDRNIARYLRVAETFRQQLPGTQLGFYGMLPVREYWAPVNEDRAGIAAWQSANTRLRPLADAVDVIFPSLYTFYDRPAQWTTYAASNLAEARQYGKPIYPFLWPQYHGSREPIAPDFWRLQLDTVYAEADGLVIWTPARGRPAWNPTAPWWLATVDFLNALPKT